MRTTSIIRKNFKLLLRSKGAAFIVIFGPLLIILLVGLALNNSGAFQISIGVHSPEYNDLASSFITEIEDAGFSVTNFTSQESCLEKIGQGTIHTCIVFPEDFRVANDKTNVIEFYVDNSKVNLVYQVIDTVSSKIELRSSELSSDLTNRVLDTLAYTKSETDESIANLITISANIDSISSSSDSIKSNVDDIDLGVSIPSTSSLLSDTQELADDATGMWALGVELFDDYNASGDSGASYLTEYLTDFEDDYYNASISSRAQSLVDSVNATAVSLVSVTEKINTAEEAKDNIKGDIDTVVDKLDDVDSDVTSVKSSLEGVADRIENVEVTSAESIVSPITTNINPIFAGSSKLSFMFPFLVMLVIMFIGILLSSTFIVMEKTSKAFFRNFTTPTKDHSFILSTFMSSGLIVAVQTIVILALGLIFLKAPFFGNLINTVLVIIISIASFVLFGMAIGYLFNTQEGATLASISISSIFLFLSSLVLPVENLPLNVQKLLSFNPYMLASETLRKVLLFDAPFRDVLGGFFTLMLYAVLALGAIIAIHTISKKTYLQTRHHLARNKPMVLHEGDHLKLDNGMVIKSKDDLHDSLKKMKEEEFRNYAFERKNEFYKWVKHTLRDKKLAKKLMTRKRDKMVKALEQSIKKDKEAEKKEKEKQDEIIKRAKKKK